MNLQKCKLFLCLFILRWLVCFKIKSFLSSKKKKKPPNPLRTTTQNKQTNKKGGEQLGTRGLVIDVIISYVF